MRKILTIGGSDPFAGGGIQSDLKTFENFQLFGMSALTCVGMLDENNAFLLENLPAKWLEQQLASIQKMTDLAGIKIGLLHSLEAIIIVRDFLKKHPQIPIVLDPVLAFKETTSLANQQYIECLVKELFPLVDLVTPNLKEAALLSGKKKISSINEVIETTKFIHTLGSKAVVVKGGSGIHGDEAIDVLYSHDGLTTFTMEKLTRSTVNGAGCTFSSAITANLVHGYTLPQAIQRSKTYVYQCILNGVEMNDQTGSVWSGGNIKGGI
ncbi:hydroxymethylpyrimidine/phosphomethylpyrimidine kinase [Enterococcus hirae]|uniref:pyridoxal kinase n=2 Tax=Enterococcus hirae TaxID=1354 RepID=I6TCV5_ENTHA|nr:hydroxymethylpyrimidine/phosphomethylpyrimidine kinase [Enterococcus hirae]AFM71244.1 phosphomethylpyrimidine kinase [Enterococcus hirae ATCC 9790]EMF0307237.1 hydroxymethylpyrimidine/phosphomethylpyrimidine kinase [Enterococcus hirae]EMF0456824.1 hydroxymethylpyrimidine/phosphomethylpyrimidine kinase [Enterococcus hirae]EOH71406.1 phosphomethylpyrimidine kinase [Enterococcus hirae ATCC 9790]EOU07634.1 phosphomethylpyrimidine kinase [Enterococcus hirae ATCC 9790]